MPARQQGASAVLQPRAKDAAAPWHWRKAPLPDAPLVLIQRNSLCRLGGDRPLPASPMLLAALQAQSDGAEALIADDSAGVVWRLRQAGAAGAQRLWQLQELGQSRSRLLSRLRGVLAPRLSGHVLHELRNPLSTLSLHADLLSRLASADGRPAPMDRIGASVDVIKRRLRDLGERQDSAVALWLEEETAAGSPSDLGRLVDASLRLVRGYLSLQEVRLRSETLDPLAGVILPRQAAALQLSLLAALLMACAGATRQGGGEVVVAARNDGGGRVLELCSALDGEALARELADSDGEGLIAALALLVEPGGIALQAQTQAALLRFTFPPG